MYALSMFMQYCNYDLGFQVGFVRLFICCVHQVPCYTRELNQPMCWEHSEIAIGDGKELVFRHPADSSSILEA